MTLTSDWAAALNQLDPPPPTDIDTPWPDWINSTLPNLATHPYAEHQHQFWDWLWNITPTSRPQAFVGVWARGGAKSSSAEAGAVALGARRVRRYGLYVCDVQDRADDHVGNIATILESDTIAARYPDLSERRIGKHGNSRGWRRNRIWTAGGFVIDAIGLDVAARGIKLEDQRPDFLIIDDIDGHRDSRTLSKSKAETLTQEIIPAGAENLAICAIQNLVVAHGVFAQLIDGKADFLRNRTVSGPIPALRNLRVEHQAATDEFPDGRDVIVEGDPTWAGQDREKCQAMLDDMGLRAFRRECQHDVTHTEGALWSTEQIDVGRVDEHPELARVVVAVDPSGGEGEGHDEQGIVAAGKDAHGEGYVLADRTCSLSPAGWGRRAVLLAIELDADRIVGETNYGGDMVISTVCVAADVLVAEGVQDAERFASGSPRVTKVTASRGKRVRAEPIAALYGEPERPETWPDARVHHVGVFGELEGEQSSWNPDVGGKSPNRVDALVWALTELGVTRRRRGGLVVRDDEPADGLITEAAKAEHREPGPRRRGGMRVRI
jgi:hypothetical protein